jgi:hypothetical protein
MACGFQGVLLAEAAGVLKRFAALTMEYYWSSSPSPDGGSRYSVAGLVTSDLFSLCHVTFTRATDTCFRRKSLRINPCW